MRTRGKPIPPDARAAILAWTPGGISLNALARSLDVNESSARTLRSRAGGRRRRRKGLGDGNEGRRPGRCGVEVLCLPDGQFDVGAKFPIIDLEFMPRLSGMVDGTAFEVTPRKGKPYKVEMQGGELVRQLTKEDFEQGYAERSGVTVEWLHANGQVGMPCDCGEDGCQGWQMVHLTFEDAVDRELVRVDT